MTDRCKNEKSLDVMKSLSWPAVKALRIHSKFLKLDLLLPAISTCDFGSALKHLILVQSDKEDLIVGKLELPNLKKLEMQLPAAIKDVDFIYPGCLSLTNLDIEMKVVKALAPPPPTRARSMTTRSMKMMKMSTPLIQFVEHSNTTSILESNIWTLLPQLRQVKIVWNVEETGQGFDDDDDDDDEKIKKEKHTFTREQYQVLQRNETSAT